MLGNSTNLLLAIILLITTSVFAQSASQKLPEVEQRQIIDLETAPIKTRQDLLRHLANRAASNPLNKLSKSAKSRLVDTLVVNQDGEISSFFTEDIDGELSPTDACRVFLLFGTPELASGVNNGRGFAPVCDRQLPDSASAGTTLAAESLPALREPDELCRSWELGQRQPAEEVQLDCLKAQQRSGALRAVSTSLLYSETDHYYSSVANTGNAAAAEIIRLLVNERERRNPPKYKNSSTIYAALLLSGQLEKAEAERVAKELDAPEIDVASMQTGRPAAPSEATYWTFGGTQNGLVKGFIDLTKGSHVVVYSARGCGFCLAAATDLMTDPRRGRIFRESSIWVETPDSNFSLQYFSSWNGRFPEFPLRAVFQRKNWPQRKIPATPYFFFVKDGQVVSEMIGWTEENKNKLDKNLAAIGL